MSHLPRGLLLVLEGIDGAGKTTQANLLAERIEAAGLPVLKSKEPTNGQWGKKLRASAQTGRLSLEEELELFVRDRREHVEQLVEPALKRGEVVILDRYFFSTAAYQGARGADVDHVFELSRFAPEPDLLVLLDVPPPVGLARIKARGDVSNEFEREDNLARCRTIFGTMTHPNLLRLDGTLPIDHVAKEILHAFVTGPLFRLLCAKDYKLDVCETVPCGFWQDRPCRWPGVNSRLVGTPQPFEELEALATSSAPVAERFNRMMELLQA